MQLTQRHALTLPASCLPAPGAPAPTDLVVHTDVASAAAAAPATVHDKQNVGRVVRYYLRFDDGVVRGGWVGALAQRRCGQGGPRGTAVAASKATRAHPPTAPALPTLQDVEFPVPRRVDEAQYDLDVGGRVFVSVPTDRMMAFDYSEIDGTAAVL